MSKHAPNEHGEDTYGEQTEKLQADAAEAERTAAEATEHKPTRHSAVTSPSPAQIKRWRRYLADEESEARIYRYLARRAEGTDREILCRLPRRRSVTSSIGVTCSANTADVHVRRPCSPYSCSSWRRTSVRCLFWRWRSARSPAPPLAEDPGRPPRKWRLMRRFTRKLSVPWRPVAGRSFRVIPCGGLWR